MEALLAEGAPTRVETFASQRRKYRHREVLVACIVGHAWALYRWRGARVGRGKGVSWMNLWCGVRSIFRELGPGALPCRVVCFVYCKKSEGRQPGFFSVPCIRREICTDPRASLLSFFQFDRDIVAVCVKGCRLQSSL